jgi:hypothetical protein
MTLDERIAQVASWLRVLTEPDRVCELRAVKVRRGSGRPHTEGGFFDTDHLEEMARLALDVSRHARGVYFTLNPLKNAILARRANRLGWAEEGELAADKDVPRRRWLLIDADPIRDAHVSATDQEKAAAWNVAQAVRDHLHKLGWPAPLLADSGNGYHLFYRLDLPAEDGGVVRGVLQALAKRFNSPSVKIDQAVFNPSRICKVPGTWARKGDNTPERPHRRARLLEVPC